MQFDLRNALGEVITNGYDGIIFQNNCKIKLNYANE